MDEATLISNHRHLLHMADGDAWDSIQQHGLESTKALVDRYAPDQETRDSILVGRRDSMIPLRAQGLRDVWIRDQIPLRRLPQALSEGTTEQEFLDLLNNRVFFWLTDDRLQRLMKAYSDRPRIVLTLDTQKLLAVHSERIELSPYNSGAVDRPNPPRRGRSMFTPIADYPYDDWLKKGRSRKEAVVELTVLDKVPDVMPFVVSVDRFVEGEPAVRLYTA